MNLKKFNSKQYPNSSSVLELFELPKNFNLKRIFRLTAYRKCIRGNHAHKKCNQILQLLQGEVNLDVINRNNKKRSFKFNIKNQFIYIPTYHWVIIHMKKGSSLNVYADQNYNRSEYIEDFQKFIN